MHLVWSWSYIYKDFDGKKTTFSTKLEFLPFGRFYHKYGVKMKLKQTFHCSAIPLRSWRSWCFFILFQIAAEAWTWCQILVLARFQCASTTLRLRFYYDPITTMKIRLRLVYADGDAVATLPRSRRWSYAFVAILIPFYIKSI